MSSVDSEYEKTASLWEKTIVRAVRDLQWHYNGAEHFRAGVSIEFDGKIERALGDGVVSAGDRLYLLEMKGDAKRKSTEWSKASKKLSFEVLSRSLQEEGTRSRPGDHQREHLLSMRGHLFVYWAPLAAYDKSTCRPGAVVASSYLLDLAENPLATQIKAIDLVSKSSLGIGKKHSEKSALIQVQQILASRLFTGTAALLRFDGEIASVLKLGLTAKEMQVYVSWLIAGQEEQDLPINAILMSRSGSVCQHVTSASELDVLIKRLNKAEREVEVAVDTASIEMPRQRPAVAKTDKEVSTSRRKSTFKH